MGRVYTRMLRSLDLRDPAIQQPQRGIHSQQHSIIRPFSRNRLGMSEIDEVHQTRWTRFCVLLLFFFHALPEKSDPLFRAFDVTLIDGQKAASHHPDLESRKHVSDCGGVFPDRLDDWQQLLLGQPLTRLFRMNREEPGDAVWQIR